MFYMGDHSLLKKTDIFCPKCNFDFTQLITDGNVGNVDFVVCLAIIRVNQQLLQYGNTSKNKKKSEISAKQTGEVNRKLGRQGRFE